MTNSLNNRSKAEEPNFISTVKKAKDEVISIHTNNSLMFGPSIHSSSDDERREEDNRVYTDHGISTSEIKQSKCLLE